MAENAKGGKGGDQGCRPISPEAREGLLILRRAMLMFLAWIEKTLGLTRT